jgi:hypothetical protein
MEALLADSQAVALVISLDSLAACSAAENSMEALLEDNRAVALVKDQVVAWEACLEAGRVEVAVEEAPAVVVASEACSEAYWEAVRYVFLATP